MLNKPFRSPLPKQSATPSDEAPDAADNGNEHPAKKRCTSTIKVAARESSGPRLVFKAPGVSSLPRKPLVPVANPAAASEIEQSLIGFVEGYYNVLW